MARKTKVTTIFLYIMSLSYLAYTLFSAFSTYEMVQTTYAGYGISAAAAQTIPYILASVLPNLFMSIVLYMLAVFNQKIEELFPRIPPKEAEEEN